MFQNIPYFGEYQRLREQKIAEIKLNSNPLDKSVEITRPAPKPIAPVPTIKSIIGKALSHISTYKDLNNKEQVVALIDDVGLNRFLIISSFIHFYHYILRVNNSMR